MSMTIPSGSSAHAIGLSGMRAAQRQLDTSAHNVANLQTPGFQRQTVVQTPQPSNGGVDTLIRREPVGAGGDNADNFGAHLAEDLVGQRMSLYSFAANLRTVQTQDDMLGSLLDTKA